MNGFSFEKMRGLRQGWDGYNSLPPSENTIQRAEHRIKGLGDFPPSRITPSCAGGDVYGTVCLTWKEGDRRAYLELYDDKGDHLLLTDGIVDPIVYNVTKFETEELIRLIQCYFYEG